MTRELVLLAAGIAIGLCLAATRQRGGGLSVVARVIGIDELRLERAIDELTRRVQGNARRRSGRAA